MSDLKPVDLYFTTEIWQHTDESLGWRLVSNLDTLDKTKTAGALREVAQQMNAEAEGSPVVISIMMHDNGLVFMDTEPDRMFFDYTTWMLTRMNMMMCLDKASSGSARVPGLFRKLIWSAEWFWLNVIGHFEGHQKAFTAKRASAPQAPLEAPTEPSKPLNNPSNQTVSNVIPLRPKAPL